MPLDLPAPWRAAHPDAVIAGRLDLSGLPHPQLLAPAARAARQLGAGLVLVRPPAPTIVAVAALRPPVAAGELDLLVDEARAAGVGAQLGELDGVRIASFVHRSTPGAAGSFLHVTYLRALEEALILLACSALSGPADRWVAGQCARLLGSVRIAHLVPAKPPLR